MNHLARRRRCAVDVFAQAACRSGAAARLHHICHIDLPDNGNRAIVVGCGHGGGGFCQLQSVPSNWCRKSRRPSSTAGPSSASATPCRRLRLCSVFSGLEGWRGYEEQQPLRLDKVCTAPSELREYDLCVRH